MWTLCGGRLIYALSDIGLNFVRQYMTGDMVCSSCEHVFHPVTDGSAAAREEEAVARDEAARAREAQHRAEVEVVRVQQGNVHGAWSRAYGGDAAAPEEAAAAQQALADCRIEVAEADQAAREADVKAQRAAASGLAFRHLPDAWLCSCGRPKAAYSWQFIGNDNPMWLPWSKLWALWHEELLEEVLQGDMVCSGCANVYNPAGDQTVPGGCPFDDQPSSWKCPGCVERDANRDCRYALQPRAKRDPGPILPAGAAGRRRRTSGRSTARRRWRTCG